MFDDPKALTSVNWNDIHVWLTLFWIYAPLVLTFALTMLTAHALIPSLIITKHLPPNAIKMRTPLTGFAMAVLIAAIVMMVLIINETLNIENFYDRWLI